MAVPDRFIRFQCEDYFLSEYAERGFWDHYSQIHVIIPAAEIKELPDQDLLVIGRPGVDGILFGYRAGLAGLWAYYPIEREFVAVAASIEELVQGWMNGSITV